MNINSLLFKLAASSLQQGNSNMQTMPATEEAVANFKMNTLPNRMFASNKNPYLNKTMQNYQVTMGGNNAKAPVQPKIKAPGLQQGVQQQPNTKLPGQKQNIFQAAASRKLASILDSFLSSDPESADTTQNIEAPIIEEPSTEPQDTLRDTKSLPEGRLKKVLEIINKLEDELGNKDEQ